jgi:hypothetical protein
MSDVIHEPDSEGVPCSCCAGTPVVPAETSVAEAPVPTEAPTLGTGTPNWSEPHVYGVEAVPDEPSE